uniref:Uncharacterized protein n=1 Tax=mine drainage metagenome TaxID=410659 RepID=E6QV15_9ZZZZ
MDNPQNLRGSKSLIILGGMVAWSEHFTRSDLAAVCFLIIHRSSEMEDFVMALYLTAI